MTLPFAYLWCKLVRARGTLSSTQQPAMRGSLFLACFIAGLVGGLATRTRQLVDQSRTYQWGPYITSCYFGPKPFCGDVGDTLIWDKDCNGDGLHDLACVKADGKRELILGQKLSMEAGGHPFCASQPSYFNPVDEPLSFNCPMFAPLSTRSAVARRLQQEFVNSERCTVEECRCSESTFDCGECWRGRSTSLPCWNFEDDGTPLCCRCLVVIAR